MRLLDVIRSSLFDPAFYAGMRSRSIQDGARYYFALALIIVFVYIVPLWGGVLMLNGALIDSLVSAYPDNLEVTLQGGELHTNQPEPYAVANPFFDHAPANIAVFDTANDDYTPESFKKVDAMILFKKTFAVAKNGSSGDERVVSYGTSTATTTLTKAELLAGAARIKPYIRPVAVIGGAFLFVLAEIIGGIAMLVFHLLYLLVPSLVIYAAFRVRSTGEDFRTAYVTALFASIPVAILSAIVGMFGGLPTFVYTLLLLLIVGLNRSTVQDKSVS